MVSEADGFRHYGRSPKLELTRFTATASRASTSAAQSVILMLIVIALTVAQFSYVEPRVQYQ